MSNCDFTKAEVPTTMDPLSAWLSSEVKKKKKSGVIRKVALNQLKIAYDVASRLVVIATRGFFSCQNSYGYTVFSSLKFFLVKIAKNAASRKTCNPKWLIFGYLVVH